jgi:histidinol-phosphate aminotransferase
LNTVLTKIETSRAKIIKIALESGLSALPSATNFVAIDCGRDGAFAKSVLDGLIARDIFVRKPAAPELDRCIRVSCGPEREMALFAAALRDVMASLK